MSSSNSNFFSKTGGYFPLRKQEIDQVSVGRLKIYENTSPYYVSDKSDINNNSKSKFTFTDRSQRFKNPYFNLKNELLGEPKEINIIHNINEPDKINSTSDLNQLKNKVTAIYNKFQMTPINNKFSKEKNLNVERELLDYLSFQEDLINQYKNNKNHSINLSGIQKINNYFFYTSPDYKQNIKTENNEKKIFDKNLDIQNINSSNFNINNNNSIKITKIKENKEINSINNKINHENKINIEKKINIKMKKNIEKKINIDNSKEIIDENFDNHKFYDSSGIKDYTYSYEKYRKKSKTPNNSCCIISKNFSVNNLDKTNSVKQNKISPIRVDQRDVTENNIDYIQIIQNNSVKIDDKESFALENQKSNKNINNYDNMPINTGISTITKDEIISNIDKIEEERLNNINIKKYNFNKDTFDKIVNNNNNNIKTENNNNKYKKSHIQNENDFSKTQRIIIDEVNYDLKANDFKIFDSNQFNNKLMNFSDKYFDDKNNDLNIENNKEVFNKENISNTYRINNMRNCNSNININNNKNIIERSTRAQEMLSELAKNNINKSLKMEDNKYFTFSVGEKFNVNQKKIDDNVKRFTSTTVKNYVPDIRLISENNEKERLFDENEYKKIMGGNETRNNKDFINFINNFECEKKKKKKSRIINNKEDSNCENNQENRGKSFSGNRKYYGIKSIWVSNNSKIMPPNEIDYLYDLYKV